MCMGFQKEDLYLVRFSLHVWEHPVQILPTKPRRGSIPITLSFPLDYLVLAYTPQMGALWG